MKVFVWFLLFADYTLRADDSTIDVDPEHLKQYPYCGKLFGYEWHDARSRTLNSRESQIQYPWVVYVKTLCFCSVFLVNHAMSSIM